MKKLAIGLVVALLGAAVFLYMGQRERVQAAEVEAARIAVLLEQAQEEAAIRQAEADSLARELVLLEEIRAQEIAEAEARARAEEARADELEEAIGELLPPEIVDAQVREQVMAAVGEIRDTYERRLADQVVILHRTESSLATSMQEALELRQSNTSLHEANALLALQVVAWKTAAQPSFFGRLRKESGLLSGALTLGVGIGAWVRGG